METPRLRLREWRETDAQDLYESACDPYIGPACGWKPHRTEEDSRKVLTEILMKPGNYAMELQETGKVIGSVSLHSYEAATIPEMKPDERELDYWVGRSWWEQGYATEASEALLRRAFREEGVSAVWGTHFDGNNRSRHVMEKMGMTYCYSEYRIAPQLHDAFLCHVRRISKEEWEQRHKTKKKA
ncbi:MAG: GNAT family N-acetyltransferase [Clostridiales bacterium]|nr:GNAT family N-acetyltransferase [Clostridiales bacterium]